VKIHNSRLDKSYLSVNLIDEISRVAFGGVIGMRRQQIKKISNGMINIFLIPLTLIALLGGIQLVLSNFQSLSRTGFIIVSSVLLAILVYIISLPIRKLINRCWKCLLWYIRKHKVPFLLSLTVVTIMWQLAVVFLLSGTGGWDPYTIMSTAIRQISPSVASMYFSLSPNTLLLTFIEHGLWLISGQPQLHYFVVLLNVVNIILIDSAVLMSAVVVKHWFGRQYEKLLIVMSWVLFVVSPWIAIPYTDNWAYFLTALLLYVGDVYGRCQYKYSRYMLAAGIGFIIIFAYFMKPSLVITVLAAGIVYILKLMVDGKNMINRTLIISFALILVGGGIGLTIHKTIVARQDLVSIKPGRAHPLVHFMAMGMKGSGAFYAPDVALDEQIKSPSARKKADVKLLIERFKDFHGLSNYGKFLAQKQINNVSDGSFGWGLEGGFLTTNESNNEKLNRTLIRRLFAKDGVVQVNNFEYRFYAQLIWCGVLANLLFTISTDRWRVQFLKYSVVGFMLFLLLFEGGRSRYVIQFLPLIFMLATVGGVRLISRLKR